MSRTPESVWQVPRNNISAVSAFLASIGGEASPDEVSVLLQLQDDPEELMALIRDWKSRA